MALPKQVPRGQAQTGCEPTLRGAMTSKGGWPAAPEAPGKTAQNIADRSRGRALPWWETPSPCIPSARPRVQVWQEQAPQPPGRVPPNPVASL